MKKALQVIILLMTGVALHIGLLEYVEYSDFHNWNLATFKYRDNIWPKDGTTVNREMFISQNIETKTFKFLRNLTWSPNIGERCLFAFPEDKRACPIDSLKFDYDKIKYSVYCEVNGKKELIAQDLTILESDSVMEKNSNKVCNRVITEGL